MNFRKDKLYYIAFEDHSISDDHKLVSCAICGWVLSQDEKRVTLTWWNVLDEDHKEGNDEPVNIIKSCITKKRLIRV